MATSSAVSFLLTGALALAGCDPCEAPVNADVTMHVELDSDVVPEGTLYVAMTDDNATFLTGYQEGVFRIAFPYDFVIHGTCDEAQVPAGVYTVTAWLSSEFRAQPYAPLASEPQGSERVEIVDPGSGRRALDDVRITISQP